MSRQSKKDRFAARQRIRRAVARIHRDNKKTPGYIGVVTSLKIDGCNYSGFGSLYFK